MSESVRSLRVSVTQVFMYLIEFKLFLHNCLVCPIIILLIPRVRWERVEEFNAQQPTSGHVPVWAWRWEGLSYLTGLVCLAGSGREGERQGHDRPRHAAANAPLLWAAHLPPPCLAAFCSPGDFMSFFCGSIHLPLLWPFQGGFRGGSQQPV